MICEGRPCLDRPQGARGAGAPYDAVVTDEQPRQDVRIHDDGSMSWVEDRGEPGVEWHVTEGPPSNPFRTVLGRKKPHERRADFLGTGLVWLAAEFDDDGNHIGYSGYWESSDPPTFLEDAGFHLTAVAAVAWGRERTPQVLIRPPGHTDHLWAGDGEPWPGRDLWVPDD